MEVDVGGCLTRVFYDLSFGVDGVDAMDEGLVIYPNPSSSKVKLSFPSEISSQGQLQIFDQLGKQIESLNLQNNEEIDVEFLESGIYLFRLRLQGRSVTARFIKI